MKNKFNPIKIISNGPKISSNGYWIPFKDNGTVDFSHNNYTDLVFRERPGKFRLEREFRKILYGRNDKWIKLLDHLSYQLDYHDKMSFFNNILEEVNALIKDHRRFNLLGIFMDKDKSNARVKSIKRYLKERIKAVKKEPGQFFLWKTADGQIINFCEWALIPVINGDVEVKNVEEYARFLGKVFGIEMKDNYKTCKSRIEQRPEIKDYYSQKFLINLKAARSERDEKKKKSST